MSEAGQCPICGKPPVAEHAPFCSARCRQVDLNRWLNESYCVPSVEDGDSDESDGPERDA